MTRRFVLDSEFATIATEIVAQALSLEQWAEVESGDMFQSENYCGGFDATEMEFCFSHYDDNDQEWWFQCAIEVVEAVARGDNISVDMRRPD